MNWFKRLFGGSKDGVTAKHRGDTARQPMVTGNQSAGTRAKDTKRTTPKAATGAAGALVNRSTKLSWIYDCGDHLAEKLEKLGVMRRDTAGVASAHWQGTNDAPQPGNISFTMTCPGCLKEEKYTTSGRETLVTCRDCNTSMKVSIHEDVTQPVGKSDIYLASTIVVSPRILARKLPLISIDAILRPTEPTVVTRAGSPKTGSALTELFRLYGDHYRAESVAVTSDDKLAYSGHSGGTILIYELASHKQIGALKGHTGKVNCLSLTHDDSMLISCGGRDSRLWRLADGSCIGVFAHKGEAIVGSASVSNKGDKLVSSDNHGGICLWDIPSGERVATFDATEQSVACFTPGSDELVLCFRDKGSFGSMCLLNSSDMMCKRQIDIGDNNISHCFRPSFTSDGKKMLLLLKGSGDNSRLQVLSTSEWVVKSQTTDTQNYITAAALSPDGGIVVISFTKYSASGTGLANESGQLEVRSFPEMKSLQAIRFENEITDLKFSTSGKLLLVASGRTRRDMCSENADSEVRVFQWQ